jgi:hypothetical protein
VETYYATTGQIRYYGQIPNTVRRSGNEVRAKGIQSSIFGEDAHLFWDDALQSASSQRIDLSRRKEPAHEALANLVLDLGSLYAFTKRWGFLVFDIDPSSGEAVTRVQQITPRQALLQQAWSGDGGAVNAIAKDARARLDVTAKGIDIAVVDLWNLIRLLFLRDYWEGKTKVCANPHCASRYFLEQRKGQQYCSHKCAVLMNVRRFRQRQTERQQTAAQTSRQAQQNSKKGKPK